jgi:WD40 repeat protein
MSPDSSVIASLSANTVIALWRTDTGQRFQTFTGHAVQVTGIAFSHDASSMVTSDKKGPLRIWQTATGECTKELSILESADVFSKRQNPSLQIAVSSDLRILACGSEDEIFVLKRSNDEEYECSARYGVSDDENQTMRVEYLEASLNSVFASWTSDTFLEPSDKHKAMVEHWRIDTENPQVVDLVQRCGSFSYQKKKNGLKIPQYTDWWQMPATGEFGWITRKEERLLWIPTELRPRSARHWDSWGSILAIGVNSDTMLIIDFSRQSNTVACKDGEIKS